MRPTATGASRSWSPATGSGPSARQRGRRWRSCSARSSSRTRGRILRSATAARPRNRCSARAGRRRRASCSGGRGRRGRFSLQRPRRPARPRLPRRPPRRPRRLRTPTRTAPPDSQDCAPHDRTIHPGARDVPDLSFVDSNCDGIDGTADDAVFASPSGNDANPGTKDRPKRQIEAALLTAAVTKKQSVYAAAGTYSRVEIENGISIYGGYDPGNWSHRSTKLITTIAGSPEAILADHQKVVAFQLFTVRGTAASHERGERVRDPRCQRIDHRAPARERRGGRRDSRSCRSQRPGRNRGRTWRRRGPGLLRRRSRRLRRRRRASRLERRRQGGTAAGAATAATSSASSG